jgi:hypothetical protein
VQYDARCAARATAVAAAEAIALEDPEAHLCTNGIAGSPGAAASRGPCPVHRSVAVRAVPPLAPDG